MPPRVEVIEAAAGQRRVLDNLMQLYFHDFSDFWTPRPGDGLGEDGLFSPYALDSYWREEGRIPLLVRADGALAGFALINRHSHIGRPVERDMAEFFIARTHRRAGVGSAAAAALFAGYPGSWEVAVMRRNLPALAFWERAVAAAAGGGPVERLDVASDDWDGWVFRFTPQSAQER